MVREAFGERGESREEGVWRCDGRVAWRRGRGDLVDGGGHRDRLREGAWMMPMREVAVGREWM